MMSSREVDRETLREWRNRAIIDADRDGETVAAHRLIVDTEDDNDDDD